MRPRRRLVRIEAPTKLGPVTPQNHSGEAHYAIDAQGDEWVIRDLLGAGQVLCEALYWSLAPVADARIADGAVFVDASGQVSWASSRIVPARHWSPSAGPLVTNLVELGGLVALDAVCAIQDRHSGNLLVTSIHGTNVAVGIDHADSLVSNAIDLERACEEELLPGYQRHLRGLPVDSLAPAALVAAERLAGLHSDFVRDIVEEACGMTGETDAANIAAALVRRLAQAGRLTNLHLERLRSLR